MDKLLVLYTMKGCPWCDLMKQKLKESKIKFVNRDIEKHDDEYKIFVKITKNEFLPAFMIIEDLNGDSKSKLFAPDRDFKDIDDGINIIKESFKK